MSAPSYIHEDTQRLNEDLARLKVLRDKVTNEATHAEQLNVDLAGPIAVARLEQAQLTSQIAGHEQVIVRVTSGYPYFEKDGFESAVGACGEIAQWQILSEIPVAGTVFGNDSADVRLPIHVQDSYAKALASKLFDGFVVCTTFDDEAVDKTHRYLFGQLMTPSFPDKEALFLVTTW